MQMNASDTAALEARAEAITSRFEATAARRGHVSPLDPDSARFARLCRAVARTWVCRAAIGRRGSYDALVAGTMVHFDRRGWMTTADIERINARRERSVKT